MASNSPSSREAEPGAEQRQGEQSSHGTECRCERRSVASWLRKWRFGTCVRRTDVRPSEGAAGRCGGGRTRGGTRGRESGGRSSRRGTEAGPLERRQGWPRRRGRGPRPRTGGAGRIVREVRGECGAFGGSPTRQSWRLVRHPDRLPTNADASRRAAPHRSRTVQPAVGEFTGLRIGGGCPGLSCPRCTRPMRRPLRFWRARRCGGGSLDRAIRRRESTRDGGGFGSQGLETPDPIVEAGALSPDLREPDVSGDGVPLPGLVEARHHRADSFARRRLSSVVYVLRCLEAVSN